MSIDVILGNITASGEAELAALRASADAEITRITEDATAKAAQRYDSARKAVLGSVSGDCARRLHGAKLEAMRIVSRARDEATSTALAQTRRRLIELRGSPDYPRILRWLIEDAVRVLGDEELNTTQTRRSAPPQIEADLRDKEILADIVAEMGLDLITLPQLNSWGGVIVRSGDGRVVVTNTLEARLERAAPYLRQELASFFMSGAV